MLDSIGSAIDTAAGALGGNASPSGDVDAVFHVGEPLADPASRAPLQISPRANGSDNSQNQFGQDAPTEFVHFGRTHADLAPRFDHPASTIAHGVMFRDALEREALLLDGQLASAKRVFKDYEDAQGALGMLGDAVDVLVGSGSSGPDPARWDELLARVTAAGGSINADQAVYPAIHQAGIDLHKARANYQAFVKEMGDAALKHGGDGAGGALGSMAGQVAGAAGSAMGSVGGPVMKAAQIVQGIVFKPFDLYLSMYLALRDEFEDAVDDASYAMTIKSVRERAAPTFHVWFPLPPAPPASDDAGGDAGADDPISKAIADAQKAIDDARREVDEKIDAVRDFLAPDAPEPATPGDAALASIFAAFSSGAVDKRNPDGSLRRRKKITPVLVKAIEDAVGVGPLPGFLADVIGKIVDKVIGLLRLILVRANGAGLDMAFSTASLRLLGREWFFNTLLDVLVDNLSFLADNGGSLFSLQGITLTRRALLEQGRDLLNDEFGQYLNPILDLAMDNLGARLRESILGAKRRNALTTEVVLARTPELTALLVRDTLLPVYDLLFDKLFGQVMGQVTSAVSPVKAMLADAQDAVNEVKSVKDKVNTVVDALGEGVGTGTDFGALADELTGGPTGLGGSTGGSFPGGMRVVACAGVPIEDADIQTVENEQPVESQVWPDPPEEAAPPAPAAAA